MTPAQVSIAAMVGMATVIALSLGAFMGIVRYLDTREARILHSVELLRGEVRELDQKVDNLALQFAVWRGKVAK